MEERNEIWARKVEGRLGKIEARLDAIADLINRAIARQDKIDQRIRYLEIRIAVIAAGIAGAIKLLT